MDPDGNGERYLIYGSGRLSIAVVRRLHATRRTAHIVLVADRATADRFTGDPSVTSSIEDEGLDAVSTCLSAARPNCLLALDDHDENNLRAATAAYEVDPAIPVVLHVFDPRFADLLEQSLSGLHVRRAYSMAGLAAPFFVAAAMAHDNLLTMRFGSVEIPFARLDVAEQSVLGATPSHVRERCNTEVVAVKGRADPCWSVVEDDGQPIPPGGAMVIAGRQADVVRAAYENSKRRTGRLADWRVLSRDRADQVWDEVKAARRIVVPSRLVALLLAALAFGAIVLGLVDKAGPTDWAYSFVRTALGEQDFEENRVWGTVLLAIGVVFLTFLFSGVTTERTARKLLPHMRAQHLRQHVIIAGLGELGYRISVLLKEADIGYAVVDAAPDERFFEAVKADRPVLVSDIRLQESLEHAGVERACALIACSESNLSNVEACMRAKSVTDISTVARVFDDRLSEAAARALNLTKTLAAVEVAASAFVDAAVHEGARRPFLLSGQSGTAPIMMVGQRLELDAPSEAELDDWRRRGVRLLVFRDAAPTGGVEAGGLALTPVQPPSRRPQAGHRIAVVVAGEAGEVARFVDDVHRTHRAVIDDGAGPHGARSVPLDVRRTPAATG